KDTKGQQRIFSYKNTLIVNSSNTLNFADLLQSFAESFFLPKFTMPIIQICLKQFINYSSKICKKNLLIIVLTCIVFDYVLKYLYEKYLFKILLAGENYSKPKKSLIWKYFKIDTDNYVCQVMEGYKMCNTK
ncbi:hypothetical protein BpHYR1_040911, partial [Brachionus plicatilis]